MSQSQEKSRNGEKNISPGKNVQKEIDSDEERTKWLNDYFAASNSDEERQLLQKMYPADNSSDSDDDIIWIGLLSPKKTHEDDRQDHEESCSSTNRLVESATDSNSASQKPSSIASSTQIYVNQVCSQKTSPKNPKPSIRVDPEVIYISSDDE